MTAPACMTVFIPLNVRQRNGRPKIVPPADCSRSSDDGIDPRMLRAIAKAWSWRRKLENGEASTILDIAKAEQVTDRFISRMLRLAWLSPVVLDEILLARRAPAVSIKNLVEAANLPWVEQPAAVFG